MNLLKKVLRHELLTGSSIYLLASVINSSIPLLLLPILTRYLTPAEYGEVAMFLVWTSLIGALSGLSVHGAANRKYFDLKDAPYKLGQYIFTCFLILLFSSLAILLIVLVASSHLSELLGLSAYWMTLGVPVAAMGFIKNIRLGQWQVRKLSAKYGVFQITHSTVNAGLSIFFVVVLLMGATGRIWGVIVSAFMFSLLALFSLYRERLIILAWKPAMAKEALRFGVPLIPHIIGGFLLNTVDRAVISAQLGLDQAGVYMVAIQVSMAATIILDAINKTFVPWLFERLKREDLSIKISIVRMTYGYYALLALGVALGFLWAGDVLLLIVGDSYAEAAHLIGWILLAKGFHGGYLMVTNYLFYKKRTGALSSITILCGILNVTLLLLLIPHFALLGVAWAFCISKLTQWIVTWIVAQHMVKMPWLSAFNLSKSSK